jgi:hypothetical protein
MRDGVEQSDGARIESAGPKPRTFAVTQGKRMRAGPWPRRLIVGAAVLASVGCGLRTARQATAQAEPAAGLLQPCPDWSTPDPAAGLQPHLLPPLSGPHCFVLGYRRHALDSLEAAAQRAAFPILAPRELPAPLTVRQITYVELDFPDPAAAPPGSLEMAIAGPNAEVVFTQGPNGPGAFGLPPGVIPRRPPPPDVESGAVTVRGVPARWERGQWRRSAAPADPLAEAEPTWVAGGPLRLFWQQGGMQYALVSAELSPDELIQLAEALERMPRGDDAPNERCTPPTVPGLACPRIV